MRPEAEEGPVLGTERLVKSMAYLIPRSLILWFLLAPHNIARVDVLADYRRVFFDGEWIQLLDAHDSDIVQTIVAA